MTYLKKTLNVVIRFLECRGFDRQEPVKGVQNGRWIYDWCQKQLEEDHCPCCVEEAIKTLFIMLEDGYYMYGEALAPGESQWTRSDTNVALRAGGFPKWPDED